MPSGHYALVFWSGLGWWRAKVFCPNCVLRALAIRTAILHRGVERVLVVIGDHKEYHGDQNGLNEPLAEVRDALDDIGVPTADGLVFMDAMSRHRCSKLLRTLPINACSYGR